MKRFITLILAAGLVLSAAAGAKAVDFKASGYWDFALDWHRSSFDKNNTSDRFSGIQRLRTQIDVIASENLKGVLFFEIGKTNWGNGDQGGALGTDGYSVKVRYSYIDWVVPDTDLKFRIGLQPYLLPNFVAGSPILDGDGAGVTAAYEFNDNVGLTLFWLRAENNNSDGVEFRGHTFRDSQNDTLDVIGLTVPVQGEGFKITPWGMYSFVGNRSLIDENNNGDIRDLRAGLLPVLPGTIVTNAYETNKSDGHAWWAGIGAELTMFEPLRIGIEGAYGSVDMGKISGAFTPRGGLAGNERSIDIKRDGWYAAAIAEYQMDVITPGLLFWYASGDDDNPYNGSERMPYLDPTWEATPFGFEGARFDDDAVLGNSLSGTWGVSARIKNLTFIENLSHMLQFSYIRGTNDKNLPARAGMTSATDFYNDSNGPVGLVYMTTKDWATELDFNTEFRMYQDLSFLLEAGWIRLDLDEGVWGSDIVNGTEKNAYKVALNLRYTF